MLMQKSINVKMISAHAQCATSQSVSHTDVAFYFITFLAFYLSHVSDLPQLITVECLQGLFPYFIAAFIVRMWG